MIEIMLFILIVVCILLLTFIFCAFKLGAKADNKDLEDFMIKAVCKKCNKCFVFREKDALIKYKYGTKYLINCPNCNKLTEIDINK